MYYMYCDKTSGKSGLVFVVVRFCFVVCLAVFWFSCLFELISCVVVLKTAGNYNSIFTKSVKFNLSMHSYLVLLSNSLNLTIWASDVSIRIIYQINISNDTSYKANDKYKNLDVYRLPS